MIVSVDTPRMRVSADAEAATLTVGMAVALGAVFMAFAAVLLAYAIVRVQAPQWPPPGEAGVPPLWPWPVLATAAAAWGSAALLWATRMAMGGAPIRRRLLALLLAIAGGLAFVSIQGLAWRWLLGAGVRPNSGLLPSAIYALTVFHAVHAVAALMALTPIAVRTARGLTVKLSSLRAVASFWHLVTAAWLAVLVAVFVA